MKPDITEAPAVDSFAAVRRNVEMIARLEENSLSKRNRRDRAADAIGSFSGSMSFVLIHVVLFTSWVLVNVVPVPGLKRFDPYPFMLLSLAVSLEAIFLATFVLMKQNRMSKRADQRAHLDLQISLLTEREVTLVLQMMHRMAGQLGLKDDLPHDEIQQLSEETPIKELADELEAKLPE